MDNTTATLSILNTSPTSILDADKMDQDFDFFKIDIHFQNEKYWYNNINRLCLSAANKILAMAISPNSRVQHYAMAFKHDLTEKDLSKYMKQQMGSQQIELKIQKFSYKDFSQSPNDQVILSNLLLNSLPKVLPSMFGFHSSCTNEELWTIPPAKFEKVVDMFVIKFKKFDELTSNPALRLSFTEYKKVDPTNSDECSGKTLYHFVHDEFVPVWDKQELRADDPVFIHKARAKNAKPINMSDWPYLSQGPQSTKITSSRDSMYHKTIDLLNKAWSSYLLTDKLFTFSRKDVTNLPAIHIIKKSNQDRTDYIRSRLAGQWSEIDSTLWPRKIQIYAGKDSYHPAAHKIADYLEQLSPINGSIIVLSNPDSLDFSQPIIQIVQKQPKFINSKGDLTDDYLQLNEKVIHVSIGELSTIIGSKTEKESMANYLRSVMTDLFVSWCMEKEVVPFSKGTLPQSIDCIWVVKQIYLPSPVVNGKTSKVRQLLISKISKEYDALKYKSFSKIYPNNNEPDPFFGEMDQINPNDPDLPILAKVLNQYISFIDNKNSYILDAYICNPELGLEAVILKPSINVLSNEEYYRHQEKVISFLLTNQQLKAFANNLGISDKLLIERIKTNDTFLRSYRDQIWSYDTFHKLFFNGKEKLLKKSKQTDLAFEKMFGQPFRLKRTKECLRLIGGLRNLSFWRPTPLSIAYSVGSNDAGKNGFGDKLTLVKGTRVRVVKCYSDNQISTDFIENYVNVLKSQLNVQLRYNLAGATSAPLLMLNHFAKQQTWRARKLRTNYQETS
ncbi:hypothetical protein PO252_02410 [Limosilactobacillus mucosae]|uniref:hypothetical protein n=1 Tax=Limosilactobacillus mucosae TaxID=97478 RepID=UPI00233F7303|nr:hypothetical protein [Limosilactobacillus mucosae]MDC2838708.1 hypothetical protein [Limosilactobacillus mucosae]